MQLYELLTNYKHLSIVERILEIDESSLDNFIIIYPKTIDGNLCYIVGPTKDFCTITGAIASSISLDQHFLLQHVECGCLEHYRKHQCVHSTLLYALALRKLCPVEYDKQLEQYKKIKLTLEQEIILSELASDLRTNSSYFKKIHLTPEITKEQGLNYLSIRIGYDKEYIVKNITEFIDLMENKKFYSYGLKLAFVHSYEVLDDESKDFYSFLLSMGHEDAAKAIQIKKSHFLKILEIYHNSGIYYSNESRKTSYYPITDLNKVDLVLNQQYLSIDRPKHTEDLICGVNYAYFLGEDRILAYHFKKRNEAILFNTLFKCKTNALWIETNESDFIYTLLPMIKKDVVIENSFFQKYPLPNININSYFEYQEGNIINTPQVEVDEKFRDTPYVTQIIDGYTKLLESLEFMKLGKDIFLLKDVESQYNFLKADLSNLKNYGEVYFDPSMKKLKVKKMNHIHVYVSFNVGLLDFKVEGENLTSEEIQAMLSAYRNKKRFVKLDNDVILEVKEEDIKDLDNFLEDFNLVKEDLNEPVSKPLNYLLKLVDGQDDFVHCDDTIYQMIKEVQNFSKSDILPDSSFLKVLRPYQIEAFKWLSVLAKFGFGGILADDMGLGKTLEILSFISTDSTPAPTLIVCPMSLVYNWENECKKWKLNSSVHLIIGNASERKQCIEQIDYHDKAIYITSYDSLRRDIFLYTETFRIVVADEAQYIKNQNALKSAAIKQVKSELRFALTGTPIENGLADLWSIFDYLMPGYLSNYHHFKTRYETLIMEDDLETLGILKKRVQPFILRRTKKDVLTELPDKIEEVYYCKMENKQEELYQTYVQKIRKDLEGDGDSILALITRLRQICITPQLIYDEPLPSAKLNMALELIKRAISSNHRILLFSQFASVFPILGKLLETENIPYFILDGKTSASKRIELVQKFNSDSSIKVFLISLKAGGTGLNLVGADMVIHLDPWWNISAQNQATDRVHRIGQTRNVHVLKLVCMNSIEEKVMLLQNLKNELAEQILLSQDKKMKLTKDDILDLIS